MNQYKKQEVALYITFAAFLIAIGIMSGNIINYLKMLGVFSILIGTGFAFFKSVVFILNKLYPEKTPSTFTIGARKTEVINYNNYESKG